MSFRGLTLALAIATMAGLTGCGAPGIPEPPSLELARPVRDLKAVRKGNEVRLTWSVPTETTDRQAFRHVGPTQICRGVGSSLAGCGTAVAELNPESPVGAIKKSRFHKNSTVQGQAGPKASYTDQLSPSLELQNPTSDLVYALSVTNSFGRSAGLSNQVLVPSAPALPAPSNLNANVSAEGVRLTWAAVSPSQDVAGLKYEYRIYRRDVQTQRDSIAGEVPVVGDNNPTFLDTGFQWEKTYDYRLTVVTVVEAASGNQEVEGDDTPATQVVTHDIFPPRTPSGLQAVFSGPGQKPFIDLVWTPNTESDFASYNVYRREEGGQAVKVNADPLKTPAYRDFDVAAGRTYLYSVSAADVRGNQSPKSPEAEETVPAGR